MPGALDHLLVLDLTSHLSGPYCAMMLADHGAEVGERMEQLEAAELKSRWRRLGHVFGFSGKCRVGHCQHRADGWKGNCVHRKAHE